MRKRANLLGGLAGLLLAGAMGIGCGGPAEPDEKKMHDMLGGGPPSLEALKNAPPRGAKQPKGDAGGQPGGAPAPGGAPPAGGQ